MATNSQDVYTAEIDVDGGRLLSGPDNVVKRLRGSFRFPTWSGDGRRLSFLSVLDRRPQIWIYSRETGAIHALAVKLAGFNRPQWDPSGDRIFVTGTDRSGRSGIFRVDANTGDAEFAIDPHTLNLNEGVWARDGRTLFDRFGIEQLGILRIDVQTGRRQALYAAPPGLDLGQENQALSPDESTLAFQWATALRHEFSDGDPGRRQRRGAGPADDNEAGKFPYGSFAWTADSKQILSVRTRDKASELWLVPVNGGSAKKIDFPSMRVFQQRINPDGRTIAFASGEAAGEVWVAENLLP